MSFTVETNPEKLASLIKEGIAVNLEKTIKDELMQHVDAIVSEIARDIARSIATKVNVYKDYSLRGGGETVIQLKFNSDQVQYVAHANK